MTRIMRYISSSLLLLLFTVANINLALGNRAFTPIQFYPNDSLLNKITNVDQRVKAFIVKDTLGGFSSPRKIETSNYFSLNRSENQPLRDREGLIVVPLDYQPFLSYINFIDTVIVSPEMLPIVFEGKILPSKLNFVSTDLDKRKITATLIDRDSIVSSDLYQYKTDQKEAYRLIDKDSTLYNNIWKVNRTTSIRKEYYTNYPQRVKLNALAFSGSPIIKKEVENKNPFKELVSAGDAIEIARPDINKYQIKQVYWRKKGEHKLELSQKSYSKNWNPNTNDNFQIQNYHKFSADYRKDKIEFSHWIEWRFNAQYIKLPNDPKIDPENDKRTPFLINDDWIRTYNKLGLDAFIKKWSYIITLDLKTPVFNKYPQDNKHKRLAGLFSPLEGNFGIGTGYTFERKSKTTKGREFKLSIDTKPFSVDIKHVGSNKVYYYYDENGERHINNTYGVVYEKKDKKYGERRYTKTELGFTLNTTLDYKYNNYTSIYTRVKFFGNYKDRSYAEVENTIKFQLNRYLATSLYVYMKFDDSQKDERMHGAWKYFAFNEVLGFGLSYNW